MIPRIQKLLLFCLSFSLISQLGKHFWPSFSFVSGIRVDYLSPILYFSDLVAVLFILTTLIDKKQRDKILTTIRIPALLVILILASSLLVAKVPYAAILGILKAIEFILLGTCLSLRSETDWKKKIIPALTVAAVIEAILVLWQIVIQSSVGGWWYLLGERTFSLETIGISTIRFQNNDFLRAYGSFPHPNVLAFFLLVVLILLFYDLKYHISIMSRKIVILALFLSSLCLLLTFSRLTIILYAVFLLYFLSTKITGKLKYIGIAAVISVFISVFFLFAQRFSVSSVLGQDAQNRLELLKVGWVIFVQHLLFGVGLYNFFYYEILYQHSITTTLLQPIHNIYLWILVQTGLVGGCAGLLFLKQTASKYILKLKERDVLSEAFFILFGAMLLVGMFDHFFLTLQQGQLMATLLISFAWIRLKG